MVPCFNCPKHSQWLINGEVWIDGKKIAQAPKRKNGKTSSTIIGDKIYVNGYEYKNGEWKRTLAALWNFQSAMRVRPNRITMGINLVNELKIAYGFTVSLDDIYEYEGIPITVDHKNPDILEVGYAMKLWW